MAYSPTPIPNDAPPGLKAWLARELYLLALELRRLEERLAELEEEDE